MLDFIYYPVSWILWFWHKVFGFVFGESSGIAWVLGIMFLVWTLRAILFKPMVNQVRSMRKMQQFAPEMKKIQKKYANDRQRQAQEMQKLQREHGFNPLGGCLPMVLQIPVFIGLFHVLRSFVPGHTENYGFNQAGVNSYLEANLFGARLSNFITQPQAALNQMHADRASVILVSIPLMILASVLTHLTARHSVARQNPEQAGTTQTAIMNKLTLYIFPLGVLLFGLFFPIGLLFYWLANNFWTLMQQRLVYKRIDREEEAQKSEAIEKRSNLAPKPGAKPDQMRKKGTAPAPGVKPQPGVKPAPNAKAAGTARKAASDNKPQPGVKPASNSKAAGASRSKPNSSAQSSSAENGAADDSTVSGLSADRSRKKNTGRKNR